MAALTTAAAAAAPAVGAEDIDFNAEAQARGMELVSCVRVRGGKSYGVYVGGGNGHADSWRFMPLVPLFVSLSLLRPTTDSCCSVAVPSASRSLRVVCCLPKQDGGGYWRR